MILPNKKNSTVHVKVPYRTVSYYPGKISLLQSLLKASHAKPRLKVSSLTNRKRSDSVRHFDANKEHEQEEQFTYTSLLVRQPKRSKRTTNLCVILSRNKWIDETIISYSVFCSLIEMDTKNWKSAGNSFS